MEYPMIKSADPRWSQVQVGQYAVVRRDSDGDVVTVYSIESSRQQAVAFARSLNLSSTAIFFRESDAVVAQVPWN
jgi:hypothetical protein